jgi:hypothetical protein
MYCLIVLPFDHPPDEAFGKPKYEVELILIKKNGIAIVLCGGHIL